VKLIEIVANAGHGDTIASIAERHEAMDFRLGLKDKDEKQVMRLFVADDKAQLVLDALQGILGPQPDGYIAVFPVEAILPRPLEDQGEEEGVATATREALYNTIAKNARLDMNFVVLVVLSTIVATIGLLENNIAVIIGAMVIAPLLGPNLALGLSAALGDIPLMWESFRTNLAGIGLAATLSFGIGFCWPLDLTSEELLARTDVGLDSIALALASGAAAVLSVTSGLPSVLVGVMVAVALLPPAAALGLMLGSGNGSMAAGAGLLLAVNIVCVNLSAKVVFLLKGIRPRTWWQQEKAKRATVTYLAIWAISLVVLIAVIYIRHAMIPQLTHMH